MRLDATLAFQSERLPVAVNNWVVEDIFLLAGRCVLMCEANHDSLSKHEPKRGPHRVERNQRGYVAQGHCLISRFAVSSPFH